MPWAKLHQFKSRYNLVRQVVSDYYTGSALQIQHSTTGGLVETHLSLPSEEHSPRLALLLRPFAHPGGDLFIGSLVDNFLAAVPEVSEEQQDFLVEQLRQGLSSPVPFIINGERLSGPELYRLFWS